MMSVFSRAGAGIQNILSEWRQPASRSSLCVGSFLFGRENGLRLPASAAALALHPAGRCPSLGSLFPPLAAVASAASHSIARPIAALRQQGPTPADGPQRNSPPAYRKAFYSVYVCSHTS